jgi:hypothetical protein
MTTTHHCRQRGLLVTRDAWLPDDARDWGAPGLVAFIGCNQLWCTACGVRVRSESGFSAAPTLPEVLVRTDWRSLPQAAPGSSFRLYACRCTVRLVSNHTALAADERDDFDDVGLPPWSCSGHPTLGPGDAIEGLVWRADAGTLAHDALVAAVDLHPRVDGLPGFLAHRVHAMLPDGAPREAFSRAVAAEIHDAALRQAVVLFFGARPTAPGLAEVAGHVTPHPEYVQGVLARWGPRETLGQYLGDALATALTLAPDGPEAPAIRECYRALATSPPGLGASLLRLLRVDPDFAASQLADIVMADAPRWATALAALRPTDITELAEVGGRLVAAGVTTRDGVLRRVRDVSPAGVAEALAVAWAGDAVEG